MPQKQQPSQPYLRPTSELDRKMMGKYEVLCRLATGGMAELFLAYQRGLAGFRKIVVLKSILPDIRGEEELVRMFLAEASITAQFNHPHIAQVFDLGVDGDALFLAMEFVQGCTLVELARGCDREGAAIPVGFTLRAGHDVALALNYAHNFTDTRGRKLVVVHRDVAEKNIMVTHEGVVKLLDFGIAKNNGARRPSTTIGQVKGSSGYMSPEQIRGDPVDGRSDIFSLGVVLHECLTGFRLFRGNTPEESMMKTLESDVSPPSISNPDVPTAVDDVVMKALSRERDQRQATALELARELERAAASELWTPEKCGALVKHHFADRLQQVRTLIEGLHEQTGEIGISQLLARIQPRSDERQTKIDAPRLVIGAPVEVNLDRATAAIQSPVRPEAQREEKTEEHLAHVPTRPPLELDFGISGERESLGAPIENVTDVHQALDARPTLMPQITNMTVDRPAPTPRPQKQITTDEVRSLLSAPAGPTLPPPPVADVPTEPPRPKPEEIDSSDLPTVEGRRPSNPSGPIPPTLPPEPATKLVVVATNPSSIPHPSGRRVLRRKKSRLPYVLGAAVVALIAIGVTLKVLNQGPFEVAPPLLPPPHEVEPVAQPQTVPVLVLEPDPPPAPQVEPETVTDPEPEPADPETPTQKPGKGGKRPGKSKAPRKH